MVYLLRQLADHHCAGGAARIGFLLSGKADATFVLIVFTGFSLLALAFELMSLWQPHWSAGSESFTARGSAPRNIGVRQNF